MRAVPACSWPITKPRTMTEEARISLPRTLVNHLLHTAQLQPSYTRWGIISSTDGKPIRCHPLNDIGCPTPRALNAMRMILKSEDEHVWALYSLGLKEIERPSPNDLICLDVQLFLVTSLGTKGVLQLKGWRVDGTDLQELEVTIKDA